VFETVKREEARHGVGIVGSEIVGLIPRRAIEMTAESYLQIENFSPAQVFENCLEDSLGSAAGEGAADLVALAQPFLDVVARATPAPGGGSVAALAGALGASLGQMVAGLSRKKKSLAAHAATLGETAEKFRAASQDLAEGIDRDAAAYELVLTANKLPRETVEEQRRRDLAIQQAFQAAVEAPLEVARKAAEVFEILGQLQSMSAPSMLSDVRVGRMMAATAVRGALENVATNLESIADPGFVSRARSEARSLASRIAESSVTASR